MNVSMSPFEVAQEPEGLKTFAPRPGMFILRPSSQIGQVLFGALVTPRHSGLFPRI